MSTSPPIAGNECSIIEVIPQLARAWSRPLEELNAYFDQLAKANDFLADLNRAIDHVPEFSGVKFTSVTQLRVYRCLLYLFTRAFQPQTFVETGVLNGFSSSFILLAMEHNGSGKLVSIDLPPEDERIRSQGTGPLPAGKQPGWAIPAFLRPRHKLLLGDARILLPQVLTSESSLDAFLHDSDHSYEHMMFEMSLAWSYLRPGGWLLCDNVEANESFSDFCRGVSAQTFIAASFDSPERTWKHGLARKASSP